MKTTFAAAVVLFFVWAAQAQTGLVSGNLNITVIPSNVGSGRFQVSGSFSDPKGQWFASDVDTGMVMWKGNNLYPIDMILSQSGANITFRVVDLYNTGFISTGTAQVLELTPNLQLPAVSSSGDSNAALATPPDHAALVNYIISKLDSVFPVNTLYTADGQTGEDRQVDVSDGVLEFSQKLRLQSFYETQTIIEPLSPNTSNFFQVKDIRADYVAIGAVNSDYIITNGGGAYVGKIEADTLRIVQAIRNFGGQSINAVSSIGLNMLFNDFGQLLVSGHRTNGLRGKVYIYNRGVGVDTFYLHQMISSDSIFPASDKRFGIGMDVSGDYLAVANNRDGIGNVRWVVVFKRDSLSGNYYIDSYFDSGVYRPERIVLDMPYMLVASNSALERYVFMYNGSSWTSLGLLPYGSYGINPEKINGGKMYLRGNDNNSIRVYNLPDYSLFAIITPPSGFTNLGSVVWNRGDTLYVSATSSFYNFGNQSILRYKVDNFIRPFWHKNISAQSITSFVADDSHCIYSTNFNSLAGDVTMMKINTDAVVVKSQGDHATAIVGRDTNDVFTSIKIGNNLALEGGVLSVISSSTGETFASNGLIKSGDTIRLGGELISNTFITGTNQALSVETSHPSVTLNVSNASSGNAISAFTTSGSSAVYGSNTNSYGVWGNSTNSSGVYGTSTNSTGVLGSGEPGVYGIGTNLPGVLGSSTSGTGVSGNSNSGLAGHFTIGPADASSLLPAIRISRVQSSGNAEDGAGGSIDFWNETNTPSSTVTALTGRIGSRILDGTPGSIDGSLEFYTTNNSSSTRKAAIDNDGTVVLDGYTTNQKIGTGWARAVFDDDGTLLADTSSVGFAASLPIIDATTYTAAQVASDTGTAVPLSTTLSPSSAVLSRVSYAGGHGIRNISGKSLKLKIDGMASVSATATEVHNYYAVLFINGTAQDNFTPSVTLTTENHRTTLSVSGIYNVPDNAVVTLRLFSDVGSKTINVHTANLTVQTI